MGISDHVTSKGIDEGELLKSIKQRNAEFTIRSSCDTPLKSAAKVNQRPGGINAQYTQNGVNYT
jgi:hypothetical protein